MSPNLAGTTSSSVAARAQAQRNADHVEPLRVILVGRTGLEAALRVDHTIELVRAKGALDAIGELADPLDAHTPRSSTVILGEGAVDTGRAANLADALRTVQPDVRVLSTGETIDGADAVIPAKVDLATLSALLRRPKPAAPAPVVQTVVQPAAVKPVAMPLQPMASASPAASASPVAPQPTAVAPPASVSPAPIDAALPPVITDADRHVLTSLLAGKDASAAALDAVSSALGARAMFLPPSAQLPTVAVPIVHAGRPLGHLAAEGATVEALAHHADWLAPWLVLIAQQDQLRRAAFTDELTGAWNRRYFLRFLQAAIEQARQTRHTVTLLYFDVDNFKTYNDTHGHSAGDDILVETVKLISAGIRPSDRVCRIGGDEFGVVFHDPEGPRNPDGRSQGPASIASIIARFQKQICEHRFPKLNDPNTRLTISGGMATFPWDGQTAQQLIDTADELAGQSKKQGKNAITFGPGAERECHRC